MLILFPISQILLAVLFLNFATMVSTRAAAALRVASAILALAGGAQLVLFGVLELDHYEALFSVVAGVAIALAGRVFLPRTLDALDASRIK